MIWTAIKPDNGSNPQVSNGVIYVLTKFSNDTNSVAFEQWFSSSNPGPNWPDSEINARLAALNAVSALDLKTIRLGAPQPDPVPVPIDVQADPAVIAQQQIDAANQQLILKKQIADAQDWAAQSADPDVQALAAQVQTAQSALGKAPQQVKL